MGTARALPIETLKWILQSDKKIKSAQITMIERYHKRLLKIVRKSRNREEGRRLIEDHKVAANWEAMEKLTGLMLNNDSSSAIV